MYWIHAFTGTERDRSTDEPVILDDDHSEGAIHVGSAKGEPGGSGAIHSGDGRASGEWSGVGLEIRAHPNTTLTFVANQKGWLGLTDPPTRSFEDEQIDLPR